MRVWPDQVVDADDDGQGVGPKEDAEEVEEEQGDVDPASNVAYCNVHLSWGWEIVKQADKSTHSEKS